MANIEKCPYGWKKLWVLFMCWWEARCPLFAFNSERRTYNPFSLVLLLSLLLFTAKKGPSTRLTRNSSTKIGCCQALSWYLSFIAIWDGKCKIWSPCARDFKWSLTDPPGHMMSRWTSRNWMLLIVFHTQGRGLISVCRPIPTPKSSRGAMDMGRCVNTTSSCCPTKRRREREREVQIMNVNLRSVAR